MPDTSNTISLQNAVNNLKFVKMYCDSPCRDGTDGLLVDGDEFV